MHRIIRTLLGAALAVVMAAPACGTGQYRTAESDKDDDGSTTSSGAGGAGGAFSAGGAGGEPSGSSASTSASSSASGTGGGAGVGGGGAGGAGGGTTACVYPVPPYGNDVGDTVNKIYQWDGYAEGTTLPAQSSKISIESYFDCDGKKGINALMVIVSTAWDGASQLEASGLNSNMQNKWQAMGIRVLTLMFENINSAPADLGTAFSWKSDYGLTSTAVAADPAFTFAPSGGGSIGLPYIVVINPRTMQIVSTTNGDPPLAHAMLEALAQANAPP